MNDAAPLDLSQIAASIQHTNVSPATSADEIAILCDEALEFAFNGVMVQPCWVAMCRKRLDGSTVRVCSAMAYPMGGSLTKSKVSEMKDLVAEGAEEVDFMANIGFLTSGDVEAFHDEIAALVEAAGSVPLKIMHELGALPEALWATAIETADAAGIAYVKNSSGWGEGGKASVELVRFMKKHVRKARLKASGGIRNAAVATTILNAGADLIGTSAGPAIMRGCEGAGTY